MAQRPRRSFSASEVDDDIVRELQDVVAHSISSSPVREPLDSLHPIDSWARATRMHITVPTPPSRTTLSLVPWFVGAGLVIAGLLYVSQYGLHIKSRVVQRGSAAIGHLLSAKDNIEQMDWDTAEHNFAAAQSQFDDAATQLNLFGPSLTGLLAKVPGLGALATGQQVIQAGLKITDAGHAISEAMAAVSKAGGLLDEKATDRLSLAQVLRPLQDALTRADNDLKSAAELLAGVDTGRLPDDVREQFVSFQRRLPELRDLIEQGSKGVAFLGRFTGTDHPRRYLLLFQNSSELRPTGGFPGSYGLITLENGRVKQVEADDIYNPDGQIRQLVVPPLQLQHITPSWGMRDANWFIDFPASARKVMAFYQQGGGAAVDGVIAMRPEVIVDILRVTGPISLPAYDLVLNADNFLATIQTEVESKKTAQPKQIIEDLAPLIMERMSSAPASQWLKIVDTFKTHITQRDMLMYFQDSELQQYVHDQNWDGRVQETVGDYLMVDISNIKGAKTDAVTDTAVKVEGRLENGVMVHRLTITRAHNGLASPYGFYRKTNYSYVRVLVPQGSTLRGISGNDHPNNKPLLTYAAEKKAVRDPELEALEATYQYDAARDATTSAESGKTGFGFWMKVELGKTQQVQLEYVVPAKYISTDYHLYVQRQPGLDLSGLEVTLEKGDGMAVRSAQPAMTEWPDSWRLHDQLRQDLELTANLGI